ncbi:hypothetical protein N7457_002582 [Penicillium paradoxum]|uniref:uncharacterized protein n=1 Tax=Penicillium paradoxum TaxID=176176 RepID=UPI0025491784|nr:uncharacterized protein N7457_002582 [Penicillium paradoxum]KAJ5787592.1 hypothetical protein N7457_002582 [Penicillium paradoxum]
MAAPFSKSGLQVLAGEYLGGSFLKWDEMSLFDQLFGVGFEPEMCVLTWELTELLCNLVIVVGPGLPDAFFLRVVLAPEFVWFGLHWAGLPNPVPLSTYSSALPDVFHSRPLAASMALHQNMGVGDQWKSLVSRLWAHFEPYASSPSAPASSAAAAAAPSAAAAAADDALPMEGIEFVSGVCVDTMVREFSPAMDVCAVPGAAAPSPVTSPAGLPEVSSWRSAAPSPSPEPEVPTKGKYRQGY